MNYDQILLAPVLSEKANDMRAEGKYVFKVAPSASKTEIKEAVRRIFEVKVIDCTTINVSGKMKRGRSRPGRTSSWKKAIVRLAPGETIKVFEGV
jgi:large subunit ribosomal protein L23